MGLVSSGGDEGFSQVALEIGTVSPTAAPFCTNTLLLGRCSCAKLPLTFGCVFAGMAGVWKALSGGLGCDWLVGDRRGVARAPLAFWVVLESERGRV